MGDKLTTVSAHRHTDPKHLSQLVHGELDWIAMKALEKDRTRRYETASGFAADIERYLRDEAVHACPPSARYRLRKFVRRNRASLAGLLLLAISLVVALAGITGGIGWAMRDRTARDEQTAQERTARQAKVSAQLELILEEVARLEKAEKWSDALVSARRAQPALAAGEAPPDIQARAHQALADLELVNRLDEIRMESGTPWADSDVRGRQAAQSDREYASALRTAGIDIDAVTLIQAVDRIKSRSSIAPALLPALDDWVAVRSVGTDEAATRRLIDVLRGADPDPWRQQMRDLLARNDWPGISKLTTATDLDRQPAATLSFLYAILHSRSPLYEEKELVLRRAQWRYPNDFWINHRLGVNLIWKDDPDQVREGIGFMRAAVAVRPSSSHAMMNLGNGYSHLHQNDEAIACYGNAIRLNSGNYVAYICLSTPLVAKGFDDEAIAALERVIKTAPNRAGGYAGLSVIHSSRRDVRLRNIARAIEMADKAVELEPTASNNWTVLGIARFRQGRWQEARSALLKSKEVAADGWGGDRRFEQSIDWFVLAMCHHHMGDSQAARVNYMQAAAWMAQNPPSSALLIRLRAEADELLGLDTRAAAKSEEAARNAAAEQERLSKRVRIAAARPGNASAHHILGVSLAENGKWAEAKTAFEEAVRLEPNEADHHHSFGGALRQQGKLAEAQSEYNLAIRLQPRRRESHHDLGLTYARLGQWENARASLQRCFELDQRDFFFLFQLASLCLYTNDLGNYRLVCHELIRDQGKTNDMGFADCTIKACVLAPGFGADAQQAMTLADTPAFKTVNGPGREWFEMARALVYYRADRFDSAAEIIARSVPMQDGVRDASASSILAMSQHRLGKVTESRSALSNAQRIISTKMPKTERGEVFGDDWHDWLHAQLLCSEAQKLLSEQRPTTQRSGEAAQLGTRR
jgi:tetratricopeptide (TPR) repeat protein